MFTGGSPPSSTLRAQQQPRSFNERSKQLISSCKSCNVTTGLFGFCKNEAANVGGFITFYN
jgi:hypothetical protein